MGSLRNCILMINLNNKTFTKSIYKMAQFKNFMIAIRRCLPGFFVGGAYDTGNGCLKFIIAICWEFCAAFK